MIFLSIKKHFPTRASEWVLASILASWGLMLLRSEATFATSPSYIGLERIASENTWGWFCLAIGVSRLVALAINGHWVPSTYHLRSITSFVSCFFWFQISLGIMASHLASTGLAVYPWLMVLDIICTYRTARDLAIDRQIKAAEGGLSGAGTR